MRNVYLTASVRTPIDRFGGKLASWTAADLGVAVAKASIGRARLRPDQIQQSIWGCARQAGGGPNVARQIVFQVSEQIGMGPTSARVAGIGKAAFIRSWSLAPVRGPRAGQPGWGA